MAERAGDSGEGGEEGRRGGREERRPDGAGLRGREGSRVKSQAARVGEMKGRAVVTWAFGGG